jgi:fucose permease
MWSSRSTAPLNCVYFGYAVGALLSLVIVRSFRSNNSLIDKNIKYSNSTIIVKGGQFQSELVGPYTIASIFCLISAIGFGLIAYKENKSKKERKVEKVRVYQSVAKAELNIQSKSTRLFNKGKFWIRCSPTTCGQGYFTYGFILISLLLLYNFFFGKTLFSFIDEENEFVLGGIEQGFTKFFISFVEQENLIKKKDSVNTMSFYWLPMLIGRILSTFVTASWISPHLMLFISLLLCLITYLFWLLFIWYIGLTPLSIFILVTANGLAISSISPTTIGWVKQFLSLSPIELSLLLSSNALGGMGFGFLCGYVFEHYNSKHLFTVLTFAILSTFTLFILIFIIQRIHSKKEKKNKPQQPISQEDRTLETFLKDELEDEIFSSDQYRTP